MNTNGHKYFNARAASVKKLKKLQCKGDKYEGTLS